MARIQPGPFTFLSALLLLGAATGCSTVLGLDDLETSADFGEEEGGSDGSGGSDDGGDTGDQGGSDDGGDTGDQGGSDDGGDTGDQGGSQDRGGAASEGGRTNRGGTTNGGEAGDSGGTGEAGRTNGEGGADPAGGQSTVAGAGGEAGTEAGGSTGEAGSGVSGSGEAGGTSVAGGGTGIECEGEPIEACGPCDSGYRERTCDDGVWSPWSECTIAVTGLCEPNTERICGGIGTQVCDDTCAWGACSCTDETEGTARCGVCMQGTVPVTCSDGLVVETGACVDEQLCNLVEGFEDNRRGWLTADYLDETSGVYLGLVVTDGYYGLVIDNPGTELNQYVCPTMPLPGTGPLFDMRSTALVTLDTGAVGAVMVRHNDEGAYLFLVGEETNEICGIFHLAADGTMSLISTCSTPLAAGVPSVVSLSAEGTTLAAQIDGLTVASGTDTRLSSGLPGVCTWALTETLSTILVDEFVVNSPARADTCQLGPNGLCYRTYTENENGSSQFTVSPSEEGLAAYASAGDNSTAGISIANYDGAPLGFGVNDTITFTGSVPVGTVFAVSLTDTTTGEGCNWLMEGMGEGTYVLDLNTVPNLCYPTNCRFERARTNAISIGTGGWGAGFYLDLSLTDIEFSQSDVAGPTLSQAGIPSEALASRCTYPYAWTYAGTGARANYTQDPLTIEELSLEVLDESEQASAGVGIELDATERDFSSVSGITIQFAALHLTSLPAELNLELKDSTSAGCSFRVDVSSVDAGDVTFDVSELWLTGPAGMPNCRLGSRNTYLDLTDVQKMEVGTGWELTGELSMTIIGFDVHSAVSPAFGQIP